MYVCMHVCMSSVVRRILPVHGGDRTDANKLLAGHIDRLTLASTTYITLPCLHVYRVS
jgi:hypothetical protein